MRNKVWFVTGASSGIGKALVKMLLNNDDFMVAATSRDIDRLRDAIGEVDSGRFLPLAVDLLSDQDVNDAIKKLLTHSAVWMLLLIMLVMSCMVF